MGRGGTATSQRPWHHQLWDPTCTWPFPSIWRQPGSEPPLQSKIMTLFLSDLRFLLPFPLGVLALGHVPSLLKSRQWQAFHRSWSHPMPTQWLQSFLRPKPLKKEPGLEPVSFHQALKPLQNLPALFVLKRHCAVVICILSIMCSSCLWRGQSVKYLLCHSESRTPSHLNLEHEFKETEKSCDWSCQKKIGSQEMVLHRLQAS